MRKLIVILALFGAMMMGTSSNASATTVTLSFYFTITNTSDPGYKGDYWVQLYVYYNGINNPVSNTVIDTRIKQGCNQISFEIPAQAEEPHYGVVILGASEAGGGYYSNTIPSQGGIWYWVNMTDCTAQISFNL